MVYCDSSFLVALNVPDAWTPAARAMATGYRDPIPLVPVGEIELFTRIHRALGERRLDMTEHAFVLWQIEQDISDGILVRKSPAAQELLGEALRLAKKYAPRLNTRPLDILHVAAARVLRYSSFASLENRQRDLASASGLRILPAKLITPNP